MLAAEFFEFAKKDNSTARPEDGTGRTYRIGLKENVNLNRPEFILYLGTALTPYWNYVHVPELNRYYFIDSWEWISNKNWVAYCTVDVLATYKNEIGLQTLYVTRSASRRDTNIIDMLYPAKADLTTQSTVTTSPFLVSDEIRINNGCFIVGCESPDGYFGNLDYYILSGNDLTDLCDYLVNDAIKDQVNGYTLNDCSIALQRSLVNPLQFIRSCMWFPIPYATMTSLGAYTQLFIFMYNTSIDCYKLTNTAVYKPSPVMLTKLNHPQYAQNGAYMNCEPFTKVQLKMPPFGIIDIDATILNHSASPYLELYVDLITGNVIMELKSGVLTLNRVTSKLGVSIEMSQVTRNYLGALTSAAGAVSSAVSLDFLGAANGIGNAIANAAPRVNTVGSNGGFADLYGDFELMYTFYTQTEVNNTEHGRPLMQTVQLNTLAGYMEIEKPDIQIFCTAQEAEMIKAYLTGGFFYE